MKGSLTLDGKPFRYGGLFHDYERTCDEWADMNEKAYGKCYICGGSMRRQIPYAPNMYPYAAFFKIIRGRNKEKFHMKVMCRACAYDFEKGVIEADGNTYYRKGEFNERKWKSARKMEGFAK